MSDLTNTAGQAHGSATRAAADEIDLRTRPAEAGRDAIGLAEAYRALRLLIGGVAISLAPIIVIVDRVFGDTFAGTGNDGFIQRGSVSAYYHGVAGDWFVGALFAVGVFMMSYEMKARQGYMLDNVLSSIAGLSAMIVALSPTDDDSCGTACPAESLAHHVHTGAAAVFFILLAVFSLYIFTKSACDAHRSGVADRLAHLFRSKFDPDCATTITKQKRQRNVIYRICGWTIVAMLIVLLISRGRGPDGEPNLVFFWAEVVMVSVFAISWLVKGNAFAALNDPASPSDEADVAPVPYPSV